MPLELIVRARAIITVCQYLLQKRYAKKTQPLAFFLTNIFLCCANSFHNMICQQIPRAEYTRKPRLPKTLDPAKSMLRDCVFVLRYNAWWPRNWVRKRGRASQDTAVGRQQSLADLGESLYEIQVEIAEKRSEEASLLERQLRDNVVNKPLHEQGADFLRSEAFRRQIAALQQSETSVRVMMQQIEDSANIERVKAMLNRTIRQQQSTDMHVHEAENRELMESIDTMNQFVDASAEAMDSLKVFGGTTEDVAQRQTDENRLASNPDFLAWQDKLRRTSEVGVSAVAESGARTVRKEAVPTAVTAPSVACAMPA